MNKNKEIGKRGRLEGYVIRTNSGFIYTDEVGQWWLGGGSHVGIALFRDRWQAIKMANKVKKQRPDLIDWTKTIPIYDMEY